MIQFKHFLLSHFFFMSVDDHLTRDDKKAIKNVLRERSREKKQNPKQSKLNEARKN